MNTFWIKRGIIVASSALLIGGVTLGVSYAQGTPGAPPDRAPRMERMNQLMDQVAANLGVTTDRLQEAYKSARESLGMPDRSQGGMGWRGRGRGGPDGEQGARPFRRPGGEEGGFQGPMRPGGFGGPGAPMRGPAA